MEHFFLELTHISFGHIVSLFERSAFGTPTYSFEEFHTTLARVRPLPALSSTVVTYATIFSWSFNIFGPRTTIDPDNGVTQ